mmetsp:Transcript_51988/g.110458  ORF Transcript_51988/g.110458 Transcript_51988/m.110458 type:complete len:112 (+) Transcript_51988:400-735(+)
MKHFSLRPFKWWEQLCYDHARHDAKVNKFGQTPTIPEAFSKLLANSKVLKGFRLRPLKKVDTSCVDIPRQSTPSTDNSISPTRTFPCKALVPLMAHTMGTSPFPLSSTIPN